MDNPIAFTIVMASILLTMYISWASRRHTRTTAAFYVAEGKIPWRLNGAAMLGDYCSAASFLGVAGAVALVGVDGWWLALGFFAAWIVVLLVIAGPLKSTGKFTVADALSARFGGRESGIRIVAMLSTLVLCTLYLVPQMVGAGHLFKLLLGWDYLPTVLVTGTLMAIYVIVGGMRGTTYNQAIQGILLFGAMVGLLIWVSISHFGGNPLAIVERGQEMVPPVVVTKEVAGTVAQMETAAAAVTTARDQMPDAPAAMTPGVELRDLMNQASLVLGLFLGTLGLPHILIRFYTVRNARAARKSAEFTIWGLAVFYAAVLLVGLAAMYVLYPTLVQLLAEGQRGMATNMAVPMLGQLLGGEIVLGIIAAGAMAAMLSTSVGLLISATTSLSHDLYAAVLRPQSTDRERLLFAKTGAGFLAAMAIGLALWLRDQNVGVLVAMCFGIAASTFAPALVFTVWWRRLTKQAVVAGMSVGLVLSLVLTFAKFFNVPHILGVPVLVNPALYSVPAAVLATVLVSYMTKDTAGRSDEFLASAHGS
ncbi:MAG: cation acetate symporter [Bacillota bacterium]